MSVLRQLLARCLALFRRRHLEAEMAEEMRQHLEARVAENLAAGMPPAEARAAAQRAFGGVAQVQERCRDERRFVWLEQGMQDVRYAARSLRKNPGLPPWWSSRSRWASGPTPRSSAWSTRCCCAPCPIANRSA